MEKTFRIDITAKDARDAEIIIAMLSDINFYAFEQNDNLLSAYSKENDFDEDSLNRILTDFSLNFNKTVIEAENWNAKWESDFEPVVVDDFVAVRASFHQPVTEVKYEIIITPKMSFGTGHHATTFLMLQAMRNLELKAKSVTDYGTGTGVLAILAHQLGAKVTAIDNDEWSIENARENFTLNFCNEVTLIQKSDPYTEIRCDVMLANINLHILKMNVDNFKQTIAPEGLLIVSGFLTDDITELQSAFVSNGFTFLNFTEKNNWVCGKFKNA
ncbi:50S ribosomal protein L11 methyltransferase [soil metagenome]